MQSPAYLKYNPHFIRNMKNLYLILAVIICFTVSCSKENGEHENSSRNLTIFFINDQHGQLNNFSKIDHIVENEKQKTNVIVACSGDMFSGNPVVDNHLEKGYPMIDVMNSVGFNVSVMGNHEFDYGESTLSDRIEQADFSWVCANVDMGSTGIPEPKEYTTISIEELRVTFLGLIETNGKENSTIPSTHPWKVRNLTFQRPEDVVSQYSNLKEQENSDLYIALTHIGHDGYRGNLGDFQLASDYPYFDLIIGGHSHLTIDTVVNNIPIFQAGSYLNYLGKIELSVINKSVSSIDFELIDLNLYKAYNAELKVIIDAYDNLPYLNEVIGYSHSFLERYMVGCFYTDAMRGVMNTDVTFQNYGGIRSHLDDGDIIKREIFEISPFNNGTVIYDMSVAEMTDFLKGSGSGYFYSGILIEQMDSTILIKDLNNNIIPDDTVLTIGINDYIPAVHEDYFPASGNIQPLTAAETLISYLENINSQVNYPNCNRYFRYQ